MYLLTILLLFCPFSIVGSTYFCSPYCAYNQCDGRTQTQCLGCDYPFYLDDAHGSRCLLDPSSNYDLFNYPFSTSPRNQTYCSAYTFLFINAGQEITISYTEPIASSHNKIRLILWVLLIDDWDSATDKIFIELTQTSQIVQVPVDNNLTSLNLTCGTYAQFQTYLKIDAEFDHSDTTSQITFNISALNSNNNNWGVKQQYLILASLCHSYCLSCNSSSNSDCSVCSSGYKLSGTTCQTSCLSYYGEVSNSSVCVACSPYCSACSQDSQKCSSCITSGTFQSFFYQENSSCLVSCPEGFTEVSSTQICTSCFSPDCLQCSTTNLSFCYSCNTTTYWLSYDCYVICPDNYYENGTNCTKNQSSTDQNQNSSNSSVNISSNFTGIQEIIMEFMTNTNNQINTFFGQQYVQQIKKTGIISIVASGAQISTITLLNNRQTAQNMYEITRFWGSFVFFEVPSWEADASQTKYMFSQKVSDILNSTSSARLLQTTNTSNKPDFWRFVRTGHTTYFVFDTYMQLALLVLCWVIVLVLHLLKGKCPKVVGPGYTLLHRVHEVVVFYIWVGALLEWLAFQSQSAYKEVSLAISVVAALYFLCYELYVFYRLIPYPFVELGSRKFAFYVERYSFFLRDLRYEEYKHLAAWSFRHLLRPYNYQILSFFRLLMVLAALPLFTDFTHGAISCLVAIQFLEIVRFLLTWPFYALWRNIYRLVMEIALLVFFTLYLVDDILSVQDTVDLNIYFSIGWAGFAFIIIYNLGFIVFFITDIIYGCCYSNRERMQMARQSYYFQLLSDFEQYQSLPSKAQYLNISKNHGSYLKMLNTIQDVEMIQVPSNKRKAVQKLIRKGNLEDKDLEKLPAVFMKIQQYQIQYNAEDNIFIIACEKVNEIYMNTKIDPNEKYNVIVSNKVQKKFILQKGTVPFYHILLKNIYDYYDQLQINYVVLQTYTKIDQNLYEPGRLIPIFQDSLSQWITIVEKKGKISKWKLNKVVDGFPIELKLLNSIKQF